MYAIVCDGVLKLMPSQYFNEHFDCVCVADFDVHKCIYIRFYIWFHGFLLRFLCTHTTHVQLYNCTLAGVRWIEICEKCGELCMCVFASWVVNVWLVREFNYNMTKWLSLLLPIWFGNATSTTKFISFDCTMCQKQKNISKCVKWWTNFTAFVWYLKVKFSISQTIEFFVVAKITRITLQLFTFCWNTTFSLIARKPNWHVCVYMPVFWDCISEVNKNWMNENQCENCSVFELWVSSFPMHELWQWQKVIATIRYGQKRDGMIVFDRNRVFHAICALHVVQYAGCR